MVHIKKIFVLYRNFYLFLSENFHLKAFEVAFFLKSEFISHSIPDEGIRVQVFLASDMINLGAKIFEKDTLADNTVVSKLCIALRQIFMVGMHA